MCLSICLPILSALPARPLRSYFSFIFYERRWIETAAYRPVDVRTKSCQNVIGKQRKRGERGCRDLLSATRSSIFESVNLFAQMRKAYRSRVDLLMSTTAFSLRFFSLFCSI